MMKQLATERYELNQREALRLEKEAENAELEAQGLAAKWDAKTLEVERERDLIRERQIDGEVEADVLDGAGLESGESGFDNLRAAYVGVTLPNKLEMAMDFGGNFQSFPESVQQRLLEHPELMQVVQEKLALTSEMSSEAIALLEANPELMTAIAPATAPVAAGISEAVVALAL